MVLAVVQSLFKLSYPSFQFFLAFPHGIEFSLEPRFGFGSHDVDQLKLVDPSLELAISSEKMVHVVRWFEMTVVERGVGAWGVMTQLERREGRRRLKRVVVERDAVE